MFLQFQLKINQLPQLTVEENYFCVFNNDSLSKATYSTLNLLNCSPPNDFEPKISNSRDHGNVSLSVRYSKNNVYFDYFTDERNIVYYDCSVHNRCENCVKSRWQCVWCVYENKCLGTKILCQQHAVNKTVSEQSCMNHYFQASTTAISLTSCFIIFIRTQSFCTITIQTMCTHSFLFKLNWNCGVQFVLLLLSHKVWIKLKSHLHEIINLLRLQNSISEFILAKFVFSEKKFNN